MTEPRRSGTTSDRWRRVSRLFEKASALDPDEREQFLEARCGDDPELRAEVESLLAADERAPAFLELGAVELVAPELETEEEPPAVAGERLGVYRLLNEIGRGGMSRVYLAERVGDQLRRQVAIKRLSTPSWQRDERLGRFHDEGMVLASLAHPNIAQVFDAGVDPAGDPYLVMEYVDGETITGWCAREDLSVDERIHCFLDVCAAVQHAHQRLIVHRDLKPSNILVDRERRVKLLDFGIAKLLEPDRWDLGDGRAPTRTGLLPMTPEYAAPEQIRGREITTATDVYGLGLVLYELLARRRPFDLKGRSASEIERIVCEEEPRKPSTHDGNEGSAARTGAPDAEATGEPGNPRGPLAADLDAIVMRALAKEPERRYGSAKELADDLRRHLRGLPVEARPPTIRYRAGKLLRRHRGAVSATVGVLLLLAATIGFYTIELRAERDQARREARRAEEVTDLLRDVFSEADPRSGSSAPKTVDELLGRSVERVQELETEPLIQAELLHFLALAYFGQGRLDEAETLFGEVLAISRDHLAPSEPRLARSLNQLGWLRLARRDADGAEEFFAEVVAAHRGWPKGESEELAHAYRGLALVQSRRGDQDAAASMLRDGIRVLQKLLGPHHPHVAQALSDLGIVLRARGDYDESGSVFEESLEIRREALGSDHPKVADSLHQLALVAEDQGDLQGAERLFARALAIRRQSLGDDHPATVDVHRELSELRTFRASGDTPFEMAPPIP